MAPKVLIHGSGAIGTVYAAFLLRAGCDVTVTCRSTYPITKISGFSISSALFPPSNTLQINPKVVRSPQEASENDGPFDYVIVTTKVLPSAKTPQTIALAVKADLTTIVLLQNGIGIEEEYISFFPSVPLLSCSIELPSSQTSPGKISTGPMERLDVGAHPPSSPNKAETFVALIKQGGCNAHLNENIQSRRWSKLLLNATWNPICALTCTRDVTFLASSPSALPVLQGITDEVVAIAQALGHAEVTKDLAEKKLEFITQRVGKHIGYEPSMLVDALKGSRMEVEAILGNPVRIAKGLGIEVPRMELLYALTKALDEANRLRKPGQSLDGDDIKELQEQEML